MDGKPANANKHSFAVKFGYGLGTVPITVKDVAFASFVLFYYTSVIGLRGSLAGLVLLLAMVWDAFSDPIAGAVSDNLRSRWGRRMPMMAISFLPLSLCFLALFNVPEGLSQLQIFCWMLVVCLLLRTFLTIFAVPYLALGAELSQDYHERSSIAGVRTLIGWFFAMILTALAWGLIFSGDGVTDGRLNPENYYIYGMVSFFCIAIGSLICVAVTAGPARQLQLPEHQSERLSLAVLLQDFRVAFRNRNFRNLFLFMLAAGVPVGLNSSLGTHFNTYFWELTTNQLMLLAVSSLIPITLMMLAMGYLNRRFEKQVALQIIPIVLALNTVWYVPGRLLGLLPENGDPLLFAFIIVHMSVLVAMVLWSTTVSASVIADIADEQELETKRRQEGVFFAAQGFSLKFVTGFGTFLGGTVIDIIQLPLGAAPGTVSEDVLFNFGLFMGPLNLVLLAAPWYFASRLQLSEAQHTEVRAKLDARKLKAGANTQP
jgi:GPH family glycoside/pentoside/hexuronide:cation symporter